MNKIVTILLVLLLAMPIYAATVTFGMLTDIHTGDAEDAGGRYYSEVPTKVAAAVAQFVSDNVDYIINLGDSMDAYDDTTELAAVVTQLNGNAGSIPVLWIIGNHDCYNAGFDKDDWMAAVGQTATYKYVDIGNLRVFALDCGYSSTGASWPTEYAYESSYIPKSKLNQLDTDLTAADAAGKFSIICSHQRLGTYGTTLDIINYQQLWDIMAEHKVIAAFSGHAHVAKHSNSLVSNSDGTDIKFFGLEAVVDGTSVNAYSVVSINDATGAITITGYSNAYSHKETTWDNSDADGDYANANNWSNGLPVSGDIAIFDAISNTVASANLDQSAIDLMELRVSTGYTAAMGDADYVYWSGTTVNMSGGFNTTKISTSCDYLRCYGLAGASKTIYLHSGSVIGTINSAMPNTDWYILSQGNVSGDYVITGGKVRQVYMGTTCGDAIISGSSELELRAQTTTPLIMGEITIISGLLDVANLAATTDKLTLEKLKILGGTIALEDGTVTITDGIELYGTPTAFTHLNTQCWPVTVKSQKSCELTQTVAAYSGNFVTGGEVRRRP